MKQRSHMILGTAALMLGLLAPIPTGAQESDGTKSLEGNVKVTFRMGTLEDGKRVPTKTYNLIVSSGTSGSKLLSGSRVPFPTSTDGDGIVYQNVGFTTEVLTWILDKKRIKLLANIENSIVIEDEDGGPPSVETRQVSVNAILENGVPMELTRVEGILDKPGFVEVEATILN